MIFVFSGIIIALLRKNDMKFSSRYRILVGDETYFVRELIKEGTAFGKSLAFAAMRKNTLFGWLVFSLLRSKSSTAHFENHSYIVL